MHLTVIGATGMVGTRLVAEALHRGHHVTAASRHPTRYECSGARSLLVDAASGEGLDAAVAEADALILSIRTSPGQEDRLAPDTARVLDAAARADVPVLVIGGAGPLRSPTDPSRRVADDQAYVPDDWRPLASASAAQLDACRAHTGARWTYLSPPAILHPGEHTGTYRRGTTTLLTAQDGTSRISAEDLAVAALDEIEHPGVNQHITVAESLDPGLGASLHVVGE